MTVLNDQDIGYVSNPGPTCLQAICLQQILIYIWIGVNSRANQLHDIKYTVKM